MTQKPLGGLTTTEIPSHSLGDLKFLFEFIYFIVILPEQIGYVSPSIGSLL